MDGSIRENGPEIVDGETEDNLTEEPHSESMKLKRKSCSDEDYTDDENDGNGDMNDENDTSVENLNETPSLVNINDETINSTRGSSSKKLKPDKKEKSFKNVKRRVKCPLCDLELATKSILKRHCLRRHPDEWFEFKCADCPSMFKTKEELWKHRDDVKHEPPKKTPKQFEKDNHTPEELREMGHIECNACGKFFHNDRMLRKHLYHSHRDMMPVPICAVCDTEFKTRQELWKHKKDTNHNDCVSLLKNYQCDACGKILKGGYYSFLHHQKLACGKEEKELEELKVHPCDICGSTFKTKHQIQCHKNAVHLKAPEVCDICGKVYKNQLALRVHKKRHDENNKKYACDDCGRSFFNNTLLKQHIRTHTKEKPFKCPMCNYSSACKENIGKHTLSVHKVKAKAIDLRKKNDAPTVINTGYIKDNRQNVNVPNEFNKTTAPIEQPFHAQLVDRNDEGETSVMLTASESSTRSYIELMNCDINPHTYTNIDPTQYQYPWENPARR
ncbi:zinc finger protein 626-like isoform X2 [Mercenaria mercenaria]|nr:zinc finger protein 626-like isoform X2 [Mercenaria mercenaria]